MRDCVHVRWRCVFITIFFSFLYNSFLYLYIERLCSWTMTLHISNRVCFLLLFIWSIYLFYLLRDCVHAWWLCIFLIVFFSYYLFIYLFHFILWDCLLVWWRCIFLIVILFFFLFIYLFFYFYFLRDCVHVWCCIFFVHFVCLFVCFILYTFDLMICYCLGI